MKNLQIDCNYCNLDESLEFLFRELKALTYDLKIPNSPEQSIFDYIINLTLNKKMEVIDELQFNISYLREMASKSKKYTDFLNRHDEISFAHRSLNRRNFKLADNQFDSLVDDNDIIEVYNASGIQICRSWSYFNMCSYSLPELLAYSWSELYLRPKYVEKTLNSIALSLFTPDSKTITYDIPQYLINEKFSRRRYSFLFKMKYASPILCKNTLKVTGFITTGELKPMTISPLAENTRFL